MPSKDKVLRALLAGSVVLNAFLLGMLVAGPGGRQGPPPPPPPPGEIVAHITRGMADADATVFRQAFAPHLPRLEADYVTVLTVPPRIQAALAATNLDAEALRAALADMRRVRDNFEDAMTQASLEAAARMSPQGRMRLWHPPGPPE